jgi:hypothetical protein
MKAVILIPVYKTELTNDERCSLKQCFKILGNYPIMLVCPIGMNTVQYDECAGRNIPTERFKPSFFDGIAGYNKLMKSRKFYQRFSDYDYMLIYQLDAWVFSDELEAWCRKGYDYIGAPWFEKHKSHEEGYGLWCAGNGGLSLRRIEAFIRVTNLNLRMKSCREIFRDEYKSIGSLFHCLSRCCSPVIGTNTLGYYMNKGEASWMWEDGFFCYGLAPTRHRLNIPSPEEAAFFSFECSPKYLFEEVTQRQLPFGCHAWRKYQYEEFWKEYIP